MKKLLATLLLITSLQGLSAAQCETVRVTSKFGQPSVRFGGAVTIEGDTMIVGDFRDETNGWKSGAVHVFSRRGENWVRQTTLYPSDPAEEMYFSDEAISLSGNTLVVGARLGRAVGGGYGGGGVPPGGIDGGLVVTGAVYVYEQIDDGVWEETQKLVPEDIQVAGQFGAAVAVQGDVMVVGSPRAEGGGRVNIFERTDTGWVPTAELTNLSPAPESLFGRFVAMSGDTVVVGAPIEPGGPEGEGRVMVFDHSDGGWKQTDEVLSDGWALDIDGDTLVVGARVDNEARVFERTGDLWQETAVLTGNNFRFGYDVAIDGDRILVGTFDDGATPPWKFYKGKVFSFERVADEWLFDMELQANDARPLDQFGRTVALDGNIAVMGAPRESDRNGAAYTFSMDGSNCASLVSSTGTEATDARISLLDGGDQILSLSAGPEQAGRLYWLAGTITGSSPGFNLRGTWIPLNPDLYFSLTVNHPNQGQFTNNVGLLDGNGEATVVLTFPPATDPSFEGFLLEHAFITWDPAMGVMHVSNTTSLYLDE